MLHQGVGGEGALHYSVCGGERMLLFLLSSTSTQSTIATSSSPPYDANANHIKNRSRIFSRYERM